MQRAYNANPDGFVWTLEKSLKYDNLLDDHDDDLEILLMEFMDEHPDAKPMNRGKRQSEPEKSKVTVRQRKTSFQKVDMMKHK